MQHIFNRAVWKFLWKFLNLKMSNFNSLKTFALFKENFHIVWWCMIYSKCYNINVIVTSPWSLQSIFYVDLPEVFWCRCGWYSQSRTCHRVSSHQAASSPTSSIWSQRWNSIGATSMRNFHNLRTLFLVKPVLPSTTTVRQPSSWASMAVLGSFSHHNLLIYVYITPVTNWDESVTSSVEKDLISGAN